MQSKVPKFPKGLVPLYNKYFRRKVTEIVMLSRINILESLNSTTEINMSQIVDAISKASNVLGSNVLLLY